MLDKKDENVMRLPSDSILSNNGGAHDAGRWRCADVKGNGVNARSIHCRSIAAVEECELDAGAGIQGTDGGRERLSQGNNTCIASKRNEITG